ncbi:MAG TPA: hypothetical protein VH575_08415 [Gemmataceae bacterium]|jgi:hypothetical protein
MTEATWLGQIAADRDNDGLRLVFADLRLRKRLMALGNAPA